MTIPGLIVMIFWNAWLYELTLYEPKIHEDEIEIKSRLLKQRIKQSQRSFVHDRISSDGKDDGVGTSY